MKNKKCLLTLPKMSSCIILNWLVKDFGVKVNFFEWTNVYNSLCVKKETNFAFSCTKVTLHQNGKKVTYE